MKGFLVFVCLVLLLVPAVTAGTTFTVTDVRPSSGPYGSTVTVTITGTGFDSTSQVTMTKCGIKYGGTSGVIYGSVSSVNANSITATFSLTGSMVVIDDYDVKVTKQSAFGEEMAELDRAFTVYKAGSSYTTSPTSTGTVETETTTTTSAAGENSVFFESEPTGAEVWLDGEEVGTTAFTYYTNREGTYAVTVKKIGFEDYQAKVTILEGKRVHFYAPLTILTATDTPSGTASVTRTAAVTTKKTVTTAANGTPAKNATTTRKSTLKIPTPLGTDPPPTTEESPADPALALGAACVAIVVAVIRRR
jgi:hypothetical protein